MKCLESACPQKNRDNPSVTNVKRNVPPDLAKKNSDGMESLILRLR